MSPRPPLSIVVPTRNRPEQARGCLQAVREACRDDDEILLADSASTDAAAVAAVARGAGALLVRLEAPGASRARNAGWRRARHPLVVFTDDDCRPAPGWADAYAAAFAADPAVTVAWGPVTVSIGGRGTADMSAAGPSRAVHGDDVGLLGGAGNLAVSRRALEQVGGFDDLLGAGTLLRASEDKDLLLRLLAHGGTGVLVADAVVEHLEWRTRSALLALHFHYGIGQGALTAKARRMGLDPRACFPDGLVRTPWRQGVQAARDGYQTGVVLSAARAAGVLRGRAAIRRLSVEDGHLRA